MYICNDERTFLNKRSTCLASLEERKEKRKKEKKKRGGGGGGKHTDVNRSFLLLSEQASTIKQIFMAPMLKYKLSRKCDKAHVVTILLFQCVLSLSRLFFAPLHHHLRKKNKKRKRKKEKEKKEKKGGGGGGGGR